MRDGKAGRRRKKEKTSKRDRERANSLLTEELQRACFVCCSPNAQSDIALKAGKSVYLLFNQLGNLEKKAGDDKQ